MNEHGRRDRDPLPKITEISCEQARSFAILRRPVVEGDRLPVSRWPTFDEGGLGRRGLNPALARRATTALGDLWIVPGNGHIALYDGSATCNPTDLAASRGMVMWGSGRAHGHSSVRGLVPDGVGRVTLVTADHGVSTVQVHHNVYAAALDAPFSSLHFSGPAGTVELGPFG